LLDVGCGCGFFLKEAGNRGWDVAGVDPSEESITHCDRLLGDSVAQKGTLKDFSQRKMYDVVTMINVLDHSTEPWSEILRVRVLIKPKGLIFLRFPNGVFHTTLYKISKIFKLENFIKDFLVFHEYSFTPYFIRRLLNDCGFANIVIQNAGFSGGTFFNRLLKKSFGVAVNILFAISAGRFATGTSLEVTAQNT
jgi:SAM-dependent methyltransferase